MNYTFIVVRRDFQFENDFYAIDKKNVDEVKKELKDKGWNILDDTPVATQLQVVVDKWALYLVFKAKKAS